MVSDVHGVPDGDVEHDDDGEGDVDQDDDRNFSPRDGDAHL